MTSAVLIITIGVCLLIAGIHITMKNVDNMIDELKQSIEKEL